MKIIAHRIGNKINGDGAAFSDSLLELDENMFELLQNYFLSAKICQNYTIESHTKKHNKDCGMIQKETSQD